MGVKELRLSLVTLTFRYYKEKEWNPALKNTLCFYNLASIIILCNDAYRMEIAFQCIDIIRLCLFLFFVTNLTNL